MSVTNKVCKRCNNTFECKAGNCQCDTVTVSIQTLQYLKKTYLDCMCVKCLLEVDQILASIEGENFPKSDELREGFHFYMENGFFVFTAQYHLLRGSCCKSGCRHCPYGFKKNNL